MTTGILRLLATFSAGIFTAGCLSAANLVVSGIGEQSSDRTVLAGSGGSPLAEGCLVEVIDFQGLTDSEIAALAASGELEGVGTRFGDAASMGDGQTDVPGTLEFLASTPQESASGALHLVAWNASVAADATEVLVLRLPGEVPADDLSGLPGYHAVDLKEATVVYGSPTATGFSTASFGGANGFASWIGGQFPVDQPPSDLEAEADPDRDGWSNFLEYALGSAPAAPGSLARIEIDLREGSAFVRYLRRSDDPGLSYEPECAGTLIDPEAWSPVTAAEQAVAAPPAPAPTGYQWCERQLPHGGTRLFVRLKVE